MNPDSGTTFLINAGLVAALVPVLLTVGQGIKAPLRIPDDWMPLVNALIGGGLAVLYTLQSGQATTWGPVAMAAVTGAFAGFSTGKAYDGAKRMGWIHRPPAMPRQATAPDHHRRPALNRMGPPHVPAP